MLLSTRIAVFVSLVFILAFGILAVIGVQRESLAARPYTRIAIAGQEALWREILHTETRRLASLRDRIAADGAVVEAFRKADLPALRRLAHTWTQPWLTSGELSDFQILDRNGHIVVSSSALAEPPRLLDISTIAAIVDGQEPAGIRQVSSDAFRIVAAKRFESWDGEPTVLAVGSKASGPLKSFGEAMDAEGYLVSTRGRLVEGTESQLWQDLDLTFPQRTGSVQQAERGDRLYAVTAIPLADISAGSAGLLVAAQDATESLLALDRLTLLTVIIMAAVAVLTVGGLYFYLRHSFNPLRRAVTILTALARGDTSATLVRRSDDEIGQIASAITELRHNLVAFNEARRQRELQRRRQERFVRRQMESLAGTLEPGARDEVLSDLGRIVAATRGGTEPTGEIDPVARLIREDDQLGPIAAVLQQMSGRVVEQHRRLSELVARLREALVRETQLATLQQELSIARDLQRSVLPADFPPRPTFAVKGLMQSANEVGGDFYDFFERRDGKLVFVIADVSGKGVPAAFFMAISRTLLKAIALFENDPAVCVRQLNDLLVVDNDQMMFVTLVFGVFDPKTGHVDFVNAGHAAPIRMRPDGSVETIVESTDVAVAVVGSVEFTSHSIDLAPGEAILLYTDGVTEAFDPGGDQFGEERLLASLESFGGAPGPDAVAEGVLAAVKSFENGGHQSDDITLLVVRYSGAARDALAAAS
ncbi:SpoIIE family protein phosphatase [Mesorhizobium sp. LHD-90]|uniref:SpoIIE family protein phosphatase n=1 Tax=Mesorhizobium sp. LHD-90 TaxID=3071414 RepID=UPI0027E03A76|nr:SpoIIE family protein phosphatase [Mesorhizobium sp. LHD-90]MDQ6435502.1 SpoIIE family protein phosphatase [Mesorhizobium sp. LHD-90]